MVVDRFDLENSLVEAELEACQRVELEIDMALKERWPGRISPHAQCTIPLTLGRPLGETAKQTLAGRYLAAGWLLSFDDRYASPTRDLFSCTATVRASLEPTSFTASEPDQ